jgi:4-hydroxybenzoate polyprenyltransferase
MGNKTLRFASSDEPVPPKGSSLNPNRDVIRGVWELARLHTREAWLCWYPAVWGACVAAGTRDVSLDHYSFARVLFGIWSGVTATHCALCTLK